MGGTTATERRPATIRDVARRAGVSIATVSRVLNDAGEVSAATTETVRRAMADLGFRPSARGRSLKTNRTNLIALVVDAPLEQSAAAVASAERAARAAGCALMLAVAADAAGRREAVALARDHGAEGVVLLSASEAAAEGPGVLIVDPAGGREAAAAAVAILLADRRA